MEFHLLILVALTFALLFPLVLYILYKRSSSREKRVCVVLLGDLGRSPRMKNHCISLAKEGYKVDVVANLETTLCNELINSKEISIHNLDSAPKWLSDCPKIVRYICKALFQGSNLTLKLLLLPKPLAYLVQNPPSIPTLSIVWLVSKTFSRYFIIDWHNYGFTILSLAFPDTHPLVIVSRIYEKVFGRLSHYNFCVSKAMQENLLKHWNIISHVLYDRPPEMFRRYDVDTSHQLFSYLANEYPCFHSPNETETRFTRMDRSLAKFKDKRPALVVSSTSWTDDEDFTILLDALSVYERSAIDDNDIPDMVLIITGKGPLRNYYDSKINTMTFTHVEICLVWLKPEHYPQLLGSADLGICLHTSSSGLDLPMKVVDMFGCGLPVCAVDFNCLSELLQHDTNGMVFKDSEMLASQLVFLLQGFPSKQTELGRMRRNLQSFQKCRWHDHWTGVVLPILKKFQT